MRHVNENHVTTDEGEEMAQSIGSPGLVEGNTENKAHNTAGESSISAAAVFSDISSVYLHGAPVLSKRWDRY